MAAIEKHITLALKVAIAEDITDWGDIYSLAFNTRRYNPKSFKEVVSKFKNSRDIQQQYAKLKTEYTQRLLMRWGGQALDDYKAKFETDQQGKPLPPQTDTDSMSEGDRATYIGILKDIAQDKSANNSEVIKAITTLSSLENYKATTPTEEVKYVRYYLPMDCQKCTLYKREQERIANRANIPETETEVDAPTQLLSSDFVKAK